jgi:DNA polymerase-3 subunit delta'
MAQTMTTAQTKTLLPQTELYERLCRLFHENRLPSSLLFAGKKGVGKWIVANLLAKTITCQNPTDNFCGECPSCRQADGFCHPDIYYLVPLPKEKKETDKEDNWYDKRLITYLQKKGAGPYTDAAEDVTNFVTIENIRKFQSNLARHPSLSKYKVGIIYEAERMLPATMDSLLKTLEEPPRDSFLIVCTDQPRFLLATIRSRLQRVSFPALESKFVASYLQQNFEIPEKEIGVVTRFAAGALYNIEQFVEKAFFEAREIAFDLLTNAVTMPASDLVVKWSGNVALENREKVERLLIHWQSMLRDLMVINALPLQTGIDPSQALINFDYADRYLEHRERFSSLQRVEMQIDKLERVRSELRRNVNPKMAAISFLVGLNQH